MIEKEETSERRRKREEEEREERELKSEPFENERIERKLSVSDSLSVI